MANLVGLDVSIQECRASGYPVMDVRGLMDRGGLLRKQHEAYVTISSPEFWPDGRNKPGATRSQLYRFDGPVSFDELVERFEQQGEGIKSFCDWENCPIEMEAPSVYDMLRLISIVDQYCGL